MSEEVDEARFYRARRLPEGLSLLSGTLKSHKWGSGLFWFDDIVYEAEEDYLGGRGRQNLKELIPPPNTLP